MFSPWQRIVADNYGGGDYAHVQTLDECCEVGDTLFTFLMIELDPKEGCDSFEEASRRIDSVVIQIDEIANLVHAARERHVNGAPA